MSSRWQVDFMRGYSSKNEKFFKGWARKAHPYLGNIVQCGVIECDSSGHVFISANCPDIGEDFIQNKIWEHQNFWAFIENLENDTFIIDANSYYRDMDHYTSILDLFSFLYRTKVNAFIQRLYFFASDEPKIHAELVNNIFAVKKLLAKFKDECELLAKQGQDHKVDMASLKPNYFQKIGGYELTEREKFNILFQDMEIMGKDVWFTNREWDCLKLYCQGRGAKETGEALGISRRTVETHFDHIKNKLKISSKSEILEIVT